MVPRVEQNKVGVTKDFDNQPKEIDFSQIYVASDKDTAETIN